ncbi:hypothetical protein [Chitinophaga sp. S165]|uniref:hypothetical protein n=1 Tax=Chitinophaga sp. S165 TaxID=2135462 RepID=UPI000D70AAA0|nr:hypothetical protein [Chitinophaga sp. S165]PWV48201.1 hypothetical protein C7475_107107 [Chitinophaga sp. S165]
MSDKLNYVNDNIVTPVYNINDKYALISEHNLTMKDLINLCGGIPSREVTECRLEIISGSKNVIHIKVFTNLYEVVRTINFESKTIDNHFMLVYKKGENIGTCLFLNQVKAAIKRRFVKLKTTALAPNHGEDTAWLGYYFWGKVGYKMAADDQIEFVKWSKEFGRNESSLRELLLTREGTELWKKYGYTWMGEFYLNGKGKCLHYLTLYLQGKNMPFDIEFPALNVWQMQ